MRTSKRFLPRSGWYSYLPRTVPCSRTVKSGSFRAGAAAAAAEEVPAGEADAAGIGAEAEAEDGTAMAELSAAAEDGAAKVAPSAAEEDGAAAGETATAESEETEATEWEETEAVAAEVRRRVSGTSANTAVEADSRRPDSSRIRKRGLFITDQSFFASAKV